MELRLARPHNRMEHGGRVHGARLYPSLAAGGDARTGATDVVPELVFTCRDVEDPAWVSE